ncbi:MAG: DMT family transporter [Rhodoferax sp.]
MNTQTFAKPEALIGSGMGFALLAALGFSGKAIFVKLAYSAAPIDAVSLLLLRMGLALPAFVWLARQASPRALRRSDWLGIAVLGALGYYLSSLFDFIGLLSISAGLERLILFSYPPLVLIVEALLQRQTISRRLGWSMLLCYAGLGLAFVHDLQQQGDWHAVLAGSAWVALCSLCYGVYMIGVGRLVGRVGASRLAGLCGLIATFLILVHWSLSPQTIPLQGLPASVWLWAGAMAIFSTALPIWWMARAIAHMGASHTAAIGSLGPILTMAFGWVLLGEAASAMQVCGMALVLVGVWRSKA